MTIFFHGLLLSMLGCLTLRQHMTWAKPVHADEKRFYIPVIISSDAILDSLKNTAGEDGADGTDLIRAAAENGLNRKRTAAERLEYFDSLLPRSTQPKRRMFHSPLGYMSASARRLNQNKQKSRNSNREGEGSAGFRYG